MSDGEISRSSIEKLAEILAILVAEGNYTYIDKIANAPSVDLAMFYLREAIRDFHSILRQGKLKNEYAKELLDKILENLREEKEDPLNSLNRAVNDIHRYCSSSPKKLREVCSLISAKALVISTKYIKTESRR